MQCMLLEVILYDPKRAYDGIKEEKQKIFFFGQ